MKNLFLYGPVLWLVVLAGCSEPPVSTGDRTEQLRGENYRFYISTAKAAEANRNRSTDISDPFDIEDVRIESEDGKKILYITVRQAAGCRDHFPEKFEVIWDGVTVLVHPPRIPLYIKLNTGGCPELAEHVNDTIAIDLYAVFEHRVFADAANLLIVNTSATPENDVEVVQ